MKLLIILVFCVSLVACQNDVEDDGQDDLAIIKGVFIALLKKAEETLDEDEFEYRLGIFTANVLEDEEDDGDGDFTTGPVLLDMYTDEELYDMNHGGGIDDRVEKEMLEMRKRGESENHFLVKRAPPAYDSTRSIKMNEVVSQGICGNCYLHTFVAALEIAYTKQTGKVKKFSEQEMTDCYYKGCHGGDFRSVAKTMAINDHLSEKSKYGPYLNEKDKNKRFTCKASVTPDGLTDIRVVGVIDVTPATVNDAVSKYGSVMTCLEWNNKCKSIGKYTGGIYKGPTVKDGCDHAVLIVGYSSSYYKVRNSHGKGYGEDGYFRIARGSNACGIEDQMAALITEKRVSKPGLAANGCPADKPNYCAKSFVCASAACVSPAAVVVEEQAEEVAEIEEILVKKRHSRDLSSDEEIVNLNKKCAPGPDRSRSCATRYKSRCSSTSIQRVCPTTCGCGGGEIPKPKPKIKLDEPHGSCTTPKIENGRVMAGSTIPSGSTLKIKCSNGYVLEGDSVKCLIQDAFSPDSRLMPECVKAGSEKLVGNGADYQGTKSTAVSGQTCMSWNKEIVQGYVPIESSQTSTHLLGNHNLCRNAGGVLPLPWCIVDTAGNMGFCFKYPGCDVCGGPDTDKYCDEYSRDCPYSTPNRMNRPANAWSMCPATCCETAGC